MILYMKTVEAEMLNKAFASYYQCKVAQDIISNVISGEITVKNNEAYDKLYSDYIKNSIAYDLACQEIEKILIGDEIIIPNAISYISPARGKLIVKLSDETKENDRLDIENFLLRKGFERVEIN